MGATKRSQNKCNDCRYTWYPKGKDLSRECPNCKSKNIKIVGPGLGSILGGLVVIGIAMAIFGGTNKSENNVSSAPINTPAATVESAPASPPESMSAQVAPTVTQSASIEEIKAATNNRELTTMAKPMAENERVVSEEELKQMKSQAAEQERRLTSEAPATTEIK